MNKIKCSYCGQMVVEVKRAYTIPPTDKKWECIAAQHGPDCPWVKSRATQLSVASATK